MPAKVNVNMRTVVHQASNGIAMGFPDVCKTPSPVGPIPIPYPNIAMSTDTADGSKDVKCDGNSVMLQGSNFKMSTGDEAGAAGGVMSQGIKGKAEFINYSFDVKFEGKAVPRLADMMVQNKGSSSANTPPMPEVQPPFPVIVIPDPDEQEEKAKDVKLDSIELKPPED